MNKRIIKKFVSLGLSIALIVHSPVSIALANESKNVYPEHEYLYIEEILPKFLESHDVVSNDIFISNAFSVYNDDLKKTSDADTYIVFDNNDVIGMLSVDCVNGAYHSSFEYDEFKEIQDYYDECEEIALISSNNRLYIEKENSMENSSSDVVQVDYSIIEKERRISYFPTKGITSLLYRKNIAVPIVANASPAGVGICWAASIASKYDYLSGNNLIATDLFYALASIYGGTPVGTTYWISLAFSYLNMNDTQIPRMMDCSEILSNIQSYNPIYIEINNSSSAHAVLLCGITFFTDETGIYRVMDPNRTVYVDIAVSEDTMNGDDDLTYVTTYGQTYTSWYNSWC